eukprot:CAMPEP_0194529560 /NCGR_PEP_ID=MMETSP0253-20130528/66285_1 /TAXON_ID=2966 /ORGANISM="Noctiluca scintillans" /LENGTH=507 /DNA_ID=CAMNT_0039374707 /DNA_START=30 /DNA_END=1554 /DNA_ORIENTATION=-
MHCVAEEITIDPAPHEACQRWQRGLINCDTALRREDLSTQDWFLGVPQEDGMMRKVLCPHESLDDPSGSLHSGDLVEFSVREDEWGPVAEQVVKFRTSPSALKLDSAFWPPDQLEAKRSMDVDLCARRFGEYQKTLAAPERLQPAAQEYFAGLSCVQAQQEQRMYADLVGTFKDDHDHSATFARCRQAWIQVQGWEAPTTTALFEADALLANTGIPRDWPRSAYSALDRYFQMLPNIMTRQDLTPHARAAWACHNFLFLRHFSEGNTRLSLLLINWVLQRSGIPFVTAFFDAEEGRSTREEAKAGQPSGNSSLLASRIAAILARVWNDVDRAADRARFSCLEAAKDKAIRKARDTAKEGVCVVCLEVQPEILVLCCGAAFHFSCMSRWLAAAPRPLCPACRALIQPPPGERPPVPDFRVPSQGGTCVMCPNMRAADCALRACSRCCTAMQRLHRVWCPRHVGGLNGAYTPWRRTVQIGDARRGVAYPVGLGRSHPEFGEVLETAGSV